MTRLVSDCPLAAMIAALVVTFADPSQQATSVDVRTVDDSVVTLTTGQRWMPGLYSIHYFGLLLGRQGASYFLLGGFPCDACDNGPDIYILRPGDSISAAVVAPYPGVKHVAGEDQPLGEAHLFLGYCTNSRENTLVAFWHPHGGTVGGVDTVTVLTPGPDSLSIRAQPESRAFVRTVSVAMQARRCRQLGP